MSSDEPDHIAAFRILTIVARPLNEPELPNIADAWALTDGLSRIEAPANIRFLEPPTVEDFQSALADKWDVIHFDGHGAATKDGGVLAFENRDGTVSILSARDFVEMLSLSGSHPRLVILSACESACGDKNGLAGVLLDAGLGAVIGTRESVTVEWTMTLMRPLYAALGKGRSIKEAFDFARLSLRNLPNGNPKSETPSIDLPVLLGEGTDGRLCEGKSRGRPVVEHARLYGWTERWAGKFHGDYVDTDEHGRRIDPPQGRKGLIAQAARALLRNEKLVTLTGTGGIGKTALAAVVSRQLAWRFPGGVFWVDGRDYLTSSIPLDAVLDAFAPVLGPTLLQTSTAQKLVQVRDYMNRLDSPCLIVLDNADMASSEAMRFLKELPQRNAALLTSREATEAGGTVINLKAMSSQESLDFLLDEVGRRKNDPSWHLTKDDVGETVLALTDIETGALLEIARHLDGHPLALLQAAAIIASDGIRRTLELVRAHPAQGREIHERFDFSYLPLGAEQKRLLHRLAAFPADFDEQAISNICTNEAFAKGDEIISDWQSDLRILRNKSLIEQHDLNREYRRFRLHPVMRDYVRIKANDSTLQSAPTPPGKTQMSADDFRVANYFGALAYALYQNLNISEAARNAVYIAAMERINMLESQERFMSEGEYGKVMAFADYLDDLFDRAGLWNDRRAVLEMGVAAAKASGDKLSVAHQTLRLAVFAGQTAEYTEARSLFYEVLTIYSESGNQSLVARTLLNLGNVELFTGNYDEARKIYNQVLSTQRELKNKSSIAKVLHQLGMLELEVENLDEAKRLHNESLNICQELHDEKGASETLHHLSAIAQRVGDNSEARRLINESLEISRKISNKPGEALGLAQIALLDVDEGNYEEGLEHSRQAEEIFLQLGNQEYISGIKVLIEQIQEKIQEKA